MKPIIFIFFLFVLNVVTICACSARPDIPDVHPRDFSEAKAVFIGKVIDVSVDDRQILRLSRHDVLYKIRFNVEKSWKGRGSEITVISDNGKGLCSGFTFQIGGKYLVYANTHDERLAVWTSAGNPSRIFNPEDSRVKRRLE